MREEQRQVRLVAWLTLATAAVVTLMLFCGVGCLGKRKAKLPRTWRCGAAITDSSYVTDVVSQLQHAVGDAYWVFGDRKQSEDARRRALTRLAMACDSLQRASKLVRQLSEKRDAFGSGPLLWDPFRIRIRLQTEAKRYCSLVVPAPAWRADPKDHLNELQKPLLMLLDAARAVAKMECEG